MDKKPQKLSLEDIVRRQEQKMMPTSGRASKKSYLAIPVDPKKKK